MPDYFEILKTNYSQDEWNLSDNDYTTLQWLSNTAKPTQNELDVLWQSTQDKIKKDACKAQAKYLLAASDWSVLPDVGLANSADYVTYRGILRGLVTQPQVSPDFPTIPEPVWS